MVLRRAEIMKIKMCLLKLGIIIDDFFLYNSVDIKRQDNSLRYLLVHSFDVRELHLKLERNFHNICIFDNIVLPCEFRYSGI